jgi:MoaA/NifB/PqqE/SkfB family radical SAM enzyme
MKNVYYISGFPKKFIEFRLSLLLLLSVLREFGFKGLKMLRKYLKDERALLNTVPNRYVKAGKDIIAVSDMPPMNSKAFRKAVIRDMEWILQEKAPGLLFAIFCVSSRCPYTCSYCYNSSLHSKEERMELPFLLESIEKLQKAGVQSIYLSGGEPMMRFDDVLKILKHFQNSGIRFWLLSTGWKLNHESLRELKNAGLKGVMISLDSFDAEQINSVKGSPKAFDQSLSAMKGASETGLIVTVDAVLSRNLLEKDPFEKYVQTAGNAGAVFINAYAPKNTEGDNSDAYAAYSLEDFQKLQNRIDENHRDKKNKPIVYSPDLWEAKRGCVGGKLFVYIDPDGNVKICPFVQKSYGNIKTGDLSQILDEIQNRFDVNRCAVNEMLRKELF